MSLVLVLLGAACNDKIELDGITVIPEFSGPICGGTFAKMEGRLDWLVELTGVPRADRPIKLHWLRHNDAQKCGSVASSCTDRRGRIYAVLEAFPHELVHGHLNRFEYQRPWIAEGLAFMLDDSIRAQVITSHSPSELMAVEDADDLDYFSAGNFVNFLREEYGMDQLMRLYALSEDTSYAEGKAAFKAALGESFEEVSDRYVTPYVTWRFGSPDCDYPEMARDGETWRRTFHADCDDPDSVGPYFGPVPGVHPPYFTTSAVFDTEESGSYTAVVLGGSPVGLTVTSCDLSFSLSRSDVDALPLTLAPGRHVVTVQVDLDAPQDVEVEIRPNVSE